MPISCEVLIIAQQEGLLPTRRARDRCPIRQNHRISKLAISKVFSFHFKHYISGLPQFVGTSTNRYNNDYSLVREETLYCQNSRNQVAVPRYYNRFIIDVTNRILKQLDGNIYIRLFFFVSFVSLMTTWAKSIFCNEFTQVDFYTNTSQRSRIGPMTLQSSLPIRITCKTPFGIRRKITRNSKRIWRLYKLLGQRLHVDPLQLMTIPVVLNGVVQVESIHITSHITHSIPLNKKIPRRPKTSEATGHLRPDGILL